MAIAGKNLVIKVSTASAGPFTAVAELKEASISQSGNNQDISTFGSDFIRRMQGLKDATYSLSGFYAPGDAGQSAIRTAWAGNDSPLFVQFLPGGATGFQQEVRVSSIEVSASAEATQDVSIELEGSGPITLV